MKYFYTLLLTSLLIVPVKSQLNNFIKYQARLQDNNEVLKEQTVNIEIYLIQDHEKGPVIFSEAHEGTSDANGLIVLQIGSINTLVYDAIEWGMGPYFLKVEVEGNQLGKVQLLAVPYALYAKETAGTFSGNFPDLENIPAGLDLNSEDDFSGSYTSLTNSPRIVSEITDILNVSTQFVHTEEDDNTSNEIQNIFKENLTVNLDNGGTYLDSINSFHAGSGITILDNEISLNENLSRDNFYLGQDTLGGIVYYIYRDSIGQQHGLIVSKIEAIDKQWANDETVIGNIRSDDGLDNTMKMPEGPLKSWLTDNFSEEWYIPAVDEVILLYFNRLFVNKSLRALEHEQLTITDGYLSSTEAGGPFVFWVSFSQHRIISRSKIWTFSNNRARAIKAF